MDLVYYHGGCPDGWCAAYVAAKKYPGVKLVPLSYGTVDFERMLEEVKDKNVLMVDFSLKTREQNDAIWRVSKSFRIYDHHKSQLAIIGDAPYATFDMSRSGAGLAWDYLFGIDSPTNDAEWLTRPWWVRYTEDQDLWRFKLNASRQINHWLNVQERTVEHWQARVEGDEDLTHVARLGYAIESFVNYSTAAAMKDLQEGVWVHQGRNYRTGLVNNGHIGTSEVGEAIYGAGYEIAMMWREDGHGMMRFGLRSNTVDVGAIAASFPGGGGHAASSGFELSIADGRALIDDILGRGHVQTSRCC